MSAINGNVLPYLYQARNTDPAVKPPEQIQVPEKLPGTIVKPETASALQAAQETVQNPTATEKRKEAEKRDARLSRNKEKPAEKNNISKTNIDGAMRISLINRNAANAYNQTGQTGSRVTLLA